MDLEEIKKLIDQAVNDFNNKPDIDFEGYSPAEMQEILYFTFGENSPIKLQKLSDSDYRKIPILNQVKVFADLIEKNNGIKLTKNGFLPKKFLVELYQKGVMKDEPIERGTRKLNRERDSMTIHLTHILVELAGLIKKRNGEITLTKKSREILKDNHKLLKLLLMTFAIKFNWAYLDRYGENEIGQVGYGFTLILLSKYGGEERLDSFYSEKYFKAFPQLLDYPEPNYESLESNAKNCYSIRTFDRFLDYFGLVETNERKEMFDSIKFVKKTDLFDKLIKCTPPKAQTKHH